MNPLSIDSGRRPYYPCYAGDELRGDLSFLKPDVRCLVEDIRKWAWASEGIENDELVLLQCALKMNWTRAKFYKLWPKARIFFTDRDGFLFYSDDEKHYRKQVEIASKRKIAGSLGGKRKHENWTTIQRESVAYASKPPSVSSSSSVAFATEGEPPPPPPPWSPVANEAVEAAPPPKQNQEPSETAPISANSALTNEEYQHFVEHSAVVEDPDGKRGVGVPSRELCQRLKEKFPGLSVMALCAQLPKFAHQNSAGLWDSMSAEQLMLESLRQHEERINPARKKPSDTEQAVNRYMQRKAARQAAGGASA